MANIAYIRVSTEDQNTARQEELSKDLKIDKYYKEKVSGKNIKDRPKHNKMMEYVREGDTVFVESISRFGRSLTDLLYLIEQLNSKQVQFRSLKESNIDTTTPTGKLVYSIFSSLAEFERETIRERRAEGIAIAKKNGVYKRRKSKISSIDDLYADIRRWENKEITKKAIQRKYDISLSTLDK